MKNADMPAMPSKISVNRKEDRPDPWQFENNAFVAPGLTKREHFAAMAMQGLMANDSSHIAFYKDDAKQLAGYAVANADALLAALESDK